jgi:hypothetical protein
MNYVTVKVFLLVLALILVALAAFGVSTQKVNFGWLGLAVWILSNLLG